MTLKECMTLKEIFPTTIFSVKLMPDCTRFHTKSSVLLRRIKNQNIEALIKKLKVETLGPLQGKHEVFKDGAIKWRLPLLKSMELEMYV